MVEDGSHVVGRGIGSVGDALQRSASSSGLLAAQRICMEKVLCQGATNPHM